MFFAPRTDVISANREGIFSVIGYFSLQIIGIGLGRLLYSDMLDPNHLAHLEAGKSLKDLSLTSKEQMTKREKHLVARTLVLQLLLCLAYLVSKEVFGAPSRRLCNLPYVLF